MARSGDLNPVSAVQKVYDFMVWMFAHLAKYPKEQTSRRSPTFGRVTPASPRSAFGVRRQSEAATPLWLRRTAAAASALLGRAPL